MSAEGSSSCISLWDGPPRQHRFLGYRIIYDVSTVVQSLYKSLEPGGLFPFYQSGLGELPFPSVAIGEDPPTRNFLGIRYISLSSYLSS